MSSTTMDASTKPKSVFNTDLLKVYYSRLFPYSQMFKWLCYGHDATQVKENPAIESDFFYKREFSFTIENDIYIRYLCFHNLEEMKKEIQKKQPHKIDIGAFYSAPPKNHNTIKQKNFFPTQRELVFDIDLTDYDEVRTGCTPDMMWEKGSWMYMAVAIKVLHDALTEDFGFKHLLWVFSGRRGVHCWVCDESARLLDDAQRTAIVNYLTLLTGNENTSDRVNITKPLHPSIERAMPTLTSMFESVILDDVNGQALLSKPENYEKVLKMIPNDDIRTRLRERWEQHPDSSSTKRWAQLTATVRDEASKIKNFKGTELLKCLDTIVLLYTYPRLDVNVSTHRNHLLKSPFVIHPKTGKVCVPITDIENCEKFDPDAVPNLVTLVDEINQYKAPPTATSDMDVEGDAAKPTVVSDLDKTSLKPIVTAFEKTFLGPLYESIREAFKEKRKDLAAVTGDW